ncbi:hypothetical protein D3C79_983480 [compost metagenome]
MAGEQVATARLGTQAVVDKGADQLGGGGFVIGVVLQHLEHLLVRPAQALRVDDDADIDRETAFDFIEVQVHRDHSANLHAQELDRRTDLEAAHRLVET